MEKPRAYKGLACKIPVVQMPTLAGTQPSVVRAPLLDAFGKALAANKLNAKELAQEWDLSIAGFMDQMLLTLWDACFLTQSEEWTQRGQANLYADETLELARWFLRGRTVGTRGRFAG